MTGVVRHGSHRVELATRSLRAASPTARALRDRRQLAHLDTQLYGEMARALARAQHRLHAGAGRLDSLSPLAVLSRGYSLTRRPSGQIVRRAEEVAPGDEVRVLLHEGRLDCRVTATREQEHDERP
jgi:exodeoxyribonuclease VII large subunit